MIKIIHDVKTGEIIEQKLNAEEIAEREARAETLRQQIAHEQAEAEAKANAKAALLNKLGITEEEAKLLFS